MGAPPGWQACESALIASLEGSGYDSPAMGDDRRWAARYQFLDALWRGRDRIVCDSELEAALHSGVEGPLGELLAGLLPGGAPGRESGERVWVALHNDRRAASFARERGGTVFVALDEAAEIAGDEPWQVALVHLSVGLISGELESFLEILGERIEDDPDRSVVLSLPCTTDEDACYEQLAELVEQRFGDGRIYGLTRPSMAAFYDFGPVLETQGDEGESDDSPEAGIEVDNSLGSETPRFDVFIAVIGAKLPGEGVTFVELPVAESRSVEAGRPAGDDQLAALHSSLSAQLAEAQRRGDLHAIERQSLLEKLEQAEDEIARLQDQLPEGSERDAAHERGAEPPAGGPRLDELLAREQTLRWELERMRGEIERLEARPVEALEAEIASLRAELELTQRELELADALLLDEGEVDDDPQDDAKGFELGDEALAKLVKMLEGNFEDFEDEDEDEDELEGTREGGREGGHGEPSPARAREWRRARAKLEHLLRKLERGGRLSALELHRELLHLKNFFTPGAPG